MIDFLLLLLPSFSFLPLLEKIYFFILVWFLWAGRWEYIGICCYLFGSYLTIHGPLRGVSLSLTAGPDEVVTLLLKPSCHFSSPITRKSRRRRNVEKEEEQELWKMESGIVAAGELRQRRHSSKRRPFEEKGKKFFYLIPKSNYRKRTRRTDLFSISSFIFRFFCVRVITSQSCSAQAEEEEEDPSSLFWVLSYHRQTKAYNTSSGWN